MYEWEDDISEISGISIEGFDTRRAFYERLLLNKFTLKIISRTVLTKIVQSIDRLKKRKFKALNFIIYPSTSFFGTVSTRVNVIPVIIDFWKMENLHQFYENYKNCEVIFISSLEVLEHLKRHKVSLNLHHLPLSLSDRFRYAAGGEKTYDIVLAGRRNEVLSAYLHEFCIKHRDVEYLYQEQENGIIYYQSNKRGRLGSYQSREEYLGLINSAFISFYSTPGIDGGEERTGGFNPVTPRFLELLSAKCLLLGRYPDNEETNFFEVATVCPNINNYQEFEATLVKYFALRNSLIDFSHYKMILDKHYTSKRYQEILDVIQDK